MERGRKEKKEVLEQMRRIVRSRPNDAVKLAFLSFIPESRYRTV